MSPVILLVTLYGFRVTDLSLFIVIEVEIYLDSSLSCFSGICNRNKILHLGELSGDLFFSSTSNIEFDKLFLIICCRRIL